MSDGDAPLGVGTTREMERFAAALGVLDGAELRFEHADDILLLDAIIACDFGEIKCGEGGCIF